MKACKVILFVTITVALSSCAAVQPVPTLVQARGTGIGIELETAAPIRLFSRQPDTVYFIKIQDPGRVYQLQAIPSNYSKGGRVYLLNLEPGRYAAVAAISTDRRQTTNHFMTFFTEDLIRKTEVTVSSGEFAFMGRYVVSQSMWMGERDRVQDHYYDVVGAALGMPRTLIGGLLSGAGWASYRGSADKVERDDRTRRDFLRRAKEDLAEGGWSTLIEDQLSK